MSHTSCPLSCRFCTGFSFSRPQGCSRSTTRCATETKIRSGAHWLGRAQINTVCQPAGSRLAVPGSPPTTWRQVSPEVHLDKQGPACPPANQLRAVSVQAGLCIFKAMSPKHGCLWIPCVIQRYLVRYLGIVGLFESHPSIPTRACAGKLAACLCFSHHKISLWSHALFTSWLLHHVPVGDERDLAGIVCVQQPECNPAKE